MNREIIMGLLVIAVTGILAVLGTFYGNYLIQIGRSKSSKESNEKIISHQDTSTLKISNAIKESQESILTQSRKTMLKQKLLPKINQEGKNNVVISGDNKGTINVGDVYNKPPQRRVTSEDLNRIFSYSHDKAFKIKVISSGSIEGNTFRDELLSELYKNGYLNLVTVTVPMSDNYFKRERLTIRDGSYGNEKWIEILVNPQE